jgi:LPS export ABC transporter protein LptC
LKREMLNPLPIRIWLKSAENRKAVILLGVIVIVLTLGAASYIATRTGYRPESTDVRLKIIPENVDLQLKDVHFTETGDPELTWEIHADAARFAKKENMAFFDRVRIRLIRADGKTLILTGKEGRLHTDTRDADLTGSVVVASSNGDIVETDRLHYSHTDRRISTDQKITLKNPRMVISGTGLSLSLEDEKVSLRSGVRAVIQADGRTRVRGRK